MKTKFIKGLFFCLCWMHTYFADAQTIPIAIVYHQKEIKLIDSVDSNDFQISKFKFYLSNVRFYNSDNLVDEESYSYHLIDLMDTSKNELLMKRNNNIAFNQIVFNLGVDSATNVAGALEGDLDPMNNMYWTWQSGYINLKLEGVFDNRIKREYHLGGYLQPFNSLQTIKLEWKNSSTMKIYIHLDDFIRSIPDSIPPQIMSPGSSSVYLSKLFAKSISSEK
jgi:hypothetical protein